MDMAVIAYPIHTEYEKEWQRTDHHALTRFQHPLRKVLT